MRSLLLLTVCCGGCFCFVESAEAQQRSGDTITVNASDLPPELYASLKQKQQVQAMGDRVKQYGEWVGIGKEVGIAVNEGLEAVTDKAEKFSQTTPGKVTIAVIIWKVVGRDIMGFIIGVPLLCISTYLAAWAWKALFRAQYIFAGYDATTGKKKYELKEPVIASTDSADAITGYQVLGGLVVVAYFIGVAVIVGVVIF